MIFYLTTKNVKGRHLNLDDIAQHLAWMGLTLKTPPTTHNTAVLF